MMYSWRHRRRALRAEIWAEFLKAVRAPEFLLPTLAMPAAFYTLFAVVVPGSNENAGYLLATFGVFAVMGPAIFGFGIAVANERERGWLDLKRLAPVPMLNYIVAKLLITLFFAGVSLLLVYCIAGSLANVRQSIYIWPLLFATHLLSALPFVLIGLALGFALSASAAVAASNILFLFLASIGGLWIPVSVFPPLLQKIAYFLPSYQLAEIALAVSRIGGPRPLLQHILIAILMTLILFALALIAASKHDK